MIVYSQYITPRVDYIFSTLLTAIGVNHFSFTTDAEVFKSSTEPKLNYSPASITENEVWIKPVSLLFEKDIKAQEIVCFDQYGVKAFFKVSSVDFHFDIFAASFYLLTRYEEHLPHKYDMYNRYAHENSIAYKENFLQLPLVNIWLKELGRVITHKFPAVTLHPKPFTFLPTYDIDIAYSYLHKGLVRSLGGFIKSAWSSEWVLVKERIDVLFDKKADPFDSFNWLHELHRQHTLQPIYFFLLAGQNKTYDKHILPHTAAIKTLVQQHSALYSVGIHPSWHSGDQRSLLEVEINVLKNLTGKTVTKSRQHYIRMTLPETYRRLLAAGIREDYSMGYGSINGFRASYCLPYLWYDVQNEETTQLTIYPFCYMDANSFYEQHASAEEALEEMEHYYDACKTVNGMFLTIWHNHFLGTDKMFTGWREIYATMVGRISKDYKKSSL